MIQIKSDRTFSQERQELFSIDGVSYTIPKEVPASLGLEAIDRTAREGEVRANRWLMIQLMGQEAYDALRTCPGVGKEDLLAIQAVCRELVFGDQEEEGKG